jgi:hypothetical protein
MRAVAAIALGLSACVGAVGDDTLVASELDLQPVAASVKLAAKGGFGDQRGGGIFADETGHAVRLRSDGSQAALESHPANPEPPGPVQRILASGPDSAWVLADNGVYAAREGWLYAVQSGIELSADAVVAAAVGGEGQCYVALRQGLYRLDGSALSELRVSGQAITGVSALAVAPAPDGSRAVWFVRAGRLQYAKQLASQRYAVSDAGLSEAALSRGVLALAGLTPAPGALGELWVLTGGGLLQHTPEHGFVVVDLPAPGRALLGAGRYVWVQAGDRLLRYAADSGKWGELSPRRVEPQPLAADASGCLWLRAGEESLAVCDAGVPRVLGLFEAGRVFLPDVALSARVAAADAPLGLSFVLDDGERIERPLEQAQKRADGSLEFALGGFDASGAVQSYSFAGLPAGQHTLTVTTRREAASGVRQLHFEMRSSESAPLSFAADIAPIFETRCAKCHKGSGPGHTLDTYNVWAAEKAKIVAAVLELRMPADGPLDPSQIESIQRWAAGGAAP